MDLLFPHTLQRAEFTLRLMAAFILLAFATATLGKVLELQESLLKTGLVLSLGAAMLVGFLYAVAFVVVPRAKDIGLSWVWALCALIPGVNLITFLVFALLPTDAVGGGNAMDT